MTEVVVASPAGSADTLPLEHCPEEEFRAYLGPTHTAASLKAALERHRRFIAMYPTLTDWLAQPLEQRLGRLRGEGRAPSLMTNPVSYHARQYLIFMGLTGRLRLPWDYLLMLDLRGFADAAVACGHTWWPAHVDGLLQRAVGAGWSTSSASQGLSFCLPRFALRHGDPTLVQRLRAEDFETLRGEINEVYATVDPRCNTRWQEEERRPGRGALSAAFAAHAIHFQFGLVLDGPKQTRPKGGVVGADVSRGVADAIESWLAYDRDRGTPLKTQRNNDLNLRYFQAFLAERAPGLEDLSRLGRAHVLDYLGWLSSRTQVRDASKLLTASTRRSALAALATMLRELHENDLAPAPGHAIVHRGDYPKPPVRMPRFIPRGELHRVVAAIDKLENPYQRCSLLVARWSGARRDEIGRLSLDCLDTYADGTYRLRIPAGKTGKERMVPLADAAAEAIQAVQALRAPDRDRGTKDRVTGDRVRYLFLQRGRHLSAAFLFDLALQQVCEDAGLLTVDGGRLVTAHRFRHTLGTDLAEAGARWRTIMSILGHETADMTMRYAHISDPEVKADYEKVMVGAEIAGPAAHRIRNHEMSQRELDWLQSNFYKSEMELGACTRLPEEGPCECDLFLTCSKFFTTKEHAPRLRRRWAREQALLEDAQQRGWPREVERHRGIQSRLETLLADLDESLDGPEGEC